jgi:hypothetical protein
MRSLIPSKSNLADELKRVAEALAKAPAGSAKRMPLLRRQAALGDLRDELARRARQDPER